MKIIAFIGDSLGFEESPIERFPEILKMDEEIELLPLAEVRSREYLVDIEKREFRDFDDSKNVIKMHSPDGRRFLQEMLGTGWNGKGVSCGRDSGIII